MNEDYYSYTKKFMSRWANIFGLGEIFISGLREKVVDFTNAKNGSKILNVCTRAGGGKTIEGKELRLKTINKLTALYDKFLE